MPAVPFDPAHIDAFPTDPGVYLFLGAKGQILYVGKAQNLRSRVRSYFGQVQDFRPVTVLVHGRARTMDYIATRDEKEALLLENSLIKKHAPRFNVRLRDDKTYFSLRLDPREKWPWFRIVRKRRREEGVYYFGPYTSALSCRRTLQFLHTLFPLRTCTDHVLANRTRPCISHEIGRCSAPCVDLVTRDEYLKNVEQAVLFLRGKCADLLDMLRSKMHKASASLDYESAALYRDRIRAIEATVARPQVTKRTGKSFDVVGLYRAENEVQLVVQSVRDGVLSAQSEFRVPAYHGADEILRSFLVQFYGPDRAVPEEVLLPEDCGDMALIEEALSEDGAVKILVPERGEKRRQLLLAERNAELAWLQRHGDRGAAHAALEALQETLHLVHFPQRIECFDISNLMGTHVVGSCAAFTDARPDKSRYRRYKVRSVEGQDDFAGMAEILRRRLQRGLKEDDLPDLIVIDGGKGQLGAVQQIFRELEIDSVDLVSLAKARSRAMVAEKRKERVFKPDQPHPYVLNQDSDALRVLIQARDEAHRFAITYHRRLRSKGQISSALELIPGIGKRKAQSLLKAFGGMAALRAASEEDLASVPGISPRLARAIRLWFETGGLVENT